MDDQLEQLHRSGTIKKVAGTAVITGTATCSASDEAFLVLELRQRIGRQGLATGEMDGSIPCGPTPNRWSMGVPGQNMPFVTGSVSVSWRAFAGDWPIEVSDAGETVVKLKGN
jgi:hypothetical protein